MLRRQTREIYAWGLLFFSLLLAAALCSHDRSLGNPSAGDRVATDSSNLLGWPGDWIADQFYRGYGWSSYVVLLGLFAITLSLFGKVPLWRLFYRLIGWLLLTPCIAVIAEGLAIAGPDDVGGGTLGLFLSKLLRDQLGWLGRAMVISTAMTLGLVLAFDNVVRGISAVLAFIFRLYSRPREKKHGTLDAVPPTRDLPESPAPATLTTTPEQIPIRHAAASVPRLATDLEDSASDDYELPPLSLLDDSEPFPYAEHDQVLRERAALLEKTFKDFNLNVKVVAINTGPVITQYEIALETGLRLQKVTRLADDVALNLKVASVRMVAPIPGKNTVGIEVPNEHREFVRLKDVILAAGDRCRNMRIPLFLGKDTEGKPLIYDLAEMPHLLIAGRTGTGKSVCLSSIILSMLMTRRPDEVKMLMIDPKRAELSEYGDLPHLMHPVVTDMKKAEAILSWAVDEMERRYDLLSQCRVRSLAAFNNLSQSEKRRRLELDPSEDVPDDLPSIVIIVDEMADLILTMKREVEGHIIRLAQKSRAAGIHLVVATQKPTVDVITGLIKSNLPARICFQVSSRSDSRVVLDEIGAEKLLGKGDMLFLQPGTSTVIRAQGTFATDEEITRVVRSLKCKPQFTEELLNIGEAGSDGDLARRLRARDELYEQAVEIVVREGRGSVSLLQRALGIGYGRAARMIDFMAEDGIVGPYRGSSAREVTVTPEEWEAMRQAG